MADATHSAAAARLIRLTEEQARHHVNLLGGAEKEVLTLVEGLDTMTEIFDLADNHRSEDVAFYNLLSRLEQTSHEIEDVLDEWNYAILKHQMEQHRSDDPAVAPPSEKVFSFIPSSFSVTSKKNVVSRRDIAKKLLSLKARLDDILVDRDRFNLDISEHTISMPQKSRSTSLIGPERVHGRDRETDILVHKLVNNGANREESSIPIIFIVGMGGLGKTTLAQLAFNHRQIKEHFDLSIWVCVSDQFDFAAIVKEILSSIGREVSIYTNQLSVLFQHVKRYISGKRFLLVLDDVWTEDDNKWQPLADTLKCGGVGSRILVTTRNERVAKIMGSRDSEIHHLGLLSDEDCVALLFHLSLLGRNDQVAFEEIGKKIVKKCNGLPLAAKILGSWLLFKSDDLREWDVILQTEIWQMEEVKTEIFASLLLSYNELSPTLKNCFSYCSVFPKDTKIDVENLIRNWMALGYLDSSVGDMELKGRECFDVLTMHSLLHVFVEDDGDKMQYCKMHYILHDFALYLRKRGRRETIGMDKSSTCQTCNPLQVSIVNEFRTIYCDKETPPNLCGCLRRLRVLSLTDCGLQSIPQGMEFLNHLRCLNLVGITKISHEGLKIIFQLYNLQTLRLKKCGLDEIPREIENLIRLGLLDLSWNDLKELPKEIGNLIHLRHLDLSWNVSLKELPSKIGNLNFLRHLNLNQNKSLGELPKSICDLQELETLNVLGCTKLCKLPEGVAQLTGLHLLSEFQGGSGCNKLGLLKNLNRLGGVLWLRITLDGDCDLAEVVADAQEAELRSKTRIEEFRIYFEESSSSSLVSVDVIGALQPHQNLRELSIWNYGGSALPKWMLSPLNQVRNLNLHFCNHLKSLPNLGKLPCLEELCIDLFEALEIVGREFLGITTGEGGDVIAFPKLKMLELRDCDKWKEWEDITVEEESAASSVMPCLTLLTITGCNILTVLPHCLLRKASSLETLRISGSTQLRQRYEDMDGYDWKCISTDNPSLQLICYS